MTDESMSFMVRLKRHHIFRMASAYAVVAYILIQVANAVFPDIGLSRTDVRTVIVVVALLFPVTLVLGWMFIPPSKDNPAKFSHWQHIRFRVGSVLALIIVVLVIFSGAYLWHANERYMKAEAVAETKASLAIPTPSAATVIPAKSIAVLPFENLSADKNNAYFADGMQDLILTKLADIGDLKVIARTSTESYGSHPGNLTTIAQQLGVATILEGSVQKAGNQVLINVQLIDASTDSHIWAQSYQRTLDNIFGVEGEVAQKVADALKAKLTPVETARVANISTTNAAAYDEYLRGEQYIAQARAGGWHSAIPKAVNAYQQAVDKDPQFALAWAKLSFSQSVLVYTGIDLSDATRQLALANAQRALALAPDLPQAHYALGYVYRFDFEAYDKALAQFEIARRGLPNNAEVDAAIAYIQDLQDDTQAAIAGLQRATMLSPRDPDLADALGRTLEELRQYGRASVAFRRMLAIAPDDPEAYSALAWLEVLQHGDVRVALALLDEAPADLQSGSEILSRRVHVLLLARDYKAAQRAVDGLRPGGRFITPLNVLMLRASVSYYAGDVQNAKALDKQALAMARTSVGGDSTETAWNTRLLIPLIQARLGHRAQALQALDKVGVMASKMDIGNLQNAIQLATAQVHAILGDANAAIAPLDAALAAPRGGDISLPLLRLDPIWDPIRHDPRFQALLKKYADTTPAPEDHSGG